MDLARHFEIYPMFSGLISDMDLSELSYEELRILRNTFFAKNGHLFKMLF